jgi:hypothetical protein
MCNQTVGLAAGAIETGGITTVTLALLKSIAKAVHPPRTLWVPYPHGYPLGQPNDPELQRRIMTAALKLAEESSGPPPILESWPG